MRAAELAVIADGFQGGASDPFRNMRAEGVRGVGQSSNVTSS